MASSLGVGVKAHSIDAPHTTPVIIPNHSPIIPNILISPIMNESKWYQIILCLTPFLEVDLFYHNLYRIQEYVKYL